MAQSGVSALHLSHSQMETWNTVPAEGQTLVWGCHRKWAAGKIWHLPSAPSSALAFGDAFHTVLEADMRQLQVQGSAQTLQQMRQAWADVLARKMGHVLSHEALIQERNRGAAMLKVYIEGVQQRFIASGRRPRAVEQVFSVQVTPTVVFRGRIDAIARSVIDWKTASRPWIEGEQHEKDQATAYIYGVQQTPYAEIDAISFEVFTATQRDQVWYGRVQHLGTRRTGAQIAAYRDQIVAVADDMRQATDHNRFAPNPGTQCAWCAYRGVCAEGQAHLDGAGKKAHTGVLRYTQEECDRVRQATPE